MYTVFRDREIMFHVSTKLPFTEGDTQQVRGMSFLARKPRSWDVPVLRCPAPRHPRLAGGSSAGPRRVAAGADACSRGSRTARLCRPNVSLSA